MSNKLLVPRIRFKEFTNAWEQGKLGNLIDKGGSGGTPNTSNAKFYNGSIPFLTIADLTKADGHIYSTEKHITNEGLNSSSAWIVPKGSLTLSIYATIGKIGIMHQNMATSQAFYSMVINDDITKKYLYYHLKKSDVFGEWTKLISTGTQANLNSEKVKSFGIFIPKNKSEQSKISSLFTHLDSLITLHQRKLLSLKNLKSRLLDRMFCDEKSQFPSIRFKEFTNAWEQEKLGECSKFYNGLTSVSKSDFGVGKDLYIDYLNVFNNTFSQFSELKKFKNSSRQNYVQFKDVILTISSETPDEVAMSSVINWKNDYKNVAFNSFCILVRFNQLEKYDVNYIGYFFRSNSFRTQAMLMAQGISRFNINQTALKKTLFLFPPNIYEQQKIGNVLYYLDSLITLHQRKLNSLKNIKNTLLDKMFV